jgi:hypothetical protein
MQGARGTEFPHAIPASAGKRLDVFEKPARYDAADEDVHRA